jgi:hypothetical protein
LASGFPKESLPARRLATGQQRSLVVQWLLSKPHNVEGDTGTCMLADIFENKQFLIICTLSFYTSRLKD